MIPSEYKSILECVLELGKELGFEEAVSMDTTLLKPMEMVRDSCEADRCHAYGKNWTCPPACGTLEECSSRLKKYPYGVLVQTVGILKKEIDTKAYRETEKKHLERFALLAEKMKTLAPGALCLGTGGCRVCKKCAYPEVCRYPEKAYSSMEAYGLFVTQVCRDNHIPYYHGKMTITYTSCVLFF